MTGFQVRFSSLVFLRQCQRVSPLTFSVVKLARVSLRVKKDLAIRAILSLREREACLATSHRHVLVAGRDGSSLVIFYTKSEEQIQSVCTVGRLAHK